MDDDTVTYLLHEDQVNITSSDAETVTVTFIEAGQITFCFILYSIVFKSLLDRAILSSHFIVTI